MARKAKQPAIPTTPEASADDGPQPLHMLLSTKTRFRTFGAWIIGDRRQPLRATKRELKNAKPL